MTNKGYYDHDGRYVVIGAGAVDYLSLTTWNGEQAEIVEKMLERIYNPSMETVSVGHGYIGARYQPDVTFSAKKTPQETHFMLTCSAYNSDKTLRHLILEKGFSIDLWKVTRIDIQITLHKRKNRRSLAKIGQDLKDGKFGEVHNRRKIEVSTQSSDTGDTIYIGSPKSEKRRRIYTKFLTDDQENVIEFERYEIQYRHATAQSAMKKVLSGGVLEIANMIQRIVKGDCEILPEKFIRLLSVNKFEPNVTGIVLNRARKESKTSDITKWWRGLRYAMLRCFNQDGVNGLICRETAFEALVISVTQDNLEPWTGWKLLSPSGEIVSIDRSWYDSE